MQAVEAEEKEDREIICSEVFSDITCELDAHAQGELKRRVRTCRGL